MMSPSDQLPSLLRDAQAAQARGDRSAALRAYAAILALDPHHPAAANSLGMAALERGAAEEADALFLRATRGDPRSADLWMNVATARRTRADAPGEGEALDAALALDQRHVMANVRRAELHDRLGEGHLAAFRWGGVVQIVAALSPRDPALDRLLDHARGQVAARQARFGREVDASLAALRDDYPRDERRRFDACVDAMIGRRRIYHNEPHGIHFPFLPADEFFNRAHFPWLASLETRSEAIRGELEAILAAPDSGFAPYVSMTPGAPDNKWTPLDRSDAWSSLYLWKYGVRQDATCARCPETVAALADVPLADIPGKGPTAFFSVLRPGARLPAHTGVSNVRAIVHLPLIVPSGCGFRVGGETRTWVEGEAFAFDDTIEHEAWNSSDAIRAVLILDVWNPHLGASERDMLRTLFATLATLEDVPTDRTAVID